MYPRPMLMEEKHQMAAWAGVPSPPPHLRSGVHHPEPSTTPPRSIPPATPHTTTNPVEPVCSGEERAATVHTSRHMARLTNLSQNRRSGPNGLSSCNATLSCLSSRVSPGPAPTPNLKRPRRYALSGSHASLHGTIIYPCIPLKNRGQLPSSIDKENLVPSPISSPASLMNRRRFSRFHQE